MAPDTVHPTAKLEERLEDLHVLLVDDDLAFLDLLEALLNAVGIKTVSRATSGREAFGLLHNPSRVVDCVLCDYSMAEGNGLQLLQAIRTAKIQNFRPDAWFILLTASGDHEVVGLAARLDVSGYLVKPVTPDKLKTTIVKARARAIRIDFNRYMQVQVPG
jgi:CheY-like chemotaxis protein